MSTPSITPKTPSRRFLLIAGATGTALAIVIAASGLITRAVSASANAQWSGSNAVPTVNLAKPQVGQASAISLPGTIQPFQKAQLYARVDGYLKSWSVDIGAPVHAGQTLAVVDAPDLDQQLAAARGDLAMAQANYRLATLTATRWSDLSQTGAVAQQVVDEKAGDREAKRAVVSALQAKVRGIEALSAYKRIAAPFDGIVTARKTDIGALITAGSNGQELFEVADLRKLRIYVQVPQTLAAKLKVGQQATFTLPEQPGQTLKASVAAISHALDPAARTMLVQLQAANPGSVGAGAYCQVTFDEPAAASNAIRIPATALIVRNAGSAVAIVGPGNKAVIRDVKLGRDYGDAVDVVAGLSPSDRIVDTPPETLRTGDAVRIAAPAPAKTKAGA